MPIIIRVINCVLITISCIINDIRILKSFHDSLLCNFKIPFSLLRIDIEGFTGNATATFSGFSQQDNTQLYTTVLCL